MRDGCGYTSQLCSMAAPMNDAHSAH